MDGIDREREGTSGASLYTFLFSDIEGSTRLLEQLGPEAPAVIARHHRLLGDVITANDGVVRRTEGDAFFATFDAPTSAVAAAIAAQERLEAEPWPSDGRVRVRMGLHTGEAVVVANEFVGLDVHRAARIMSVGWGGQILLSDATAGLVQSTLTGATLRDLGPHLLKDIAAAERIHQVIAPGLRTNFPALRSLSTVPDNLPAQPTSFVGRRREVGEIVELLVANRALTLTGPGGTGKTRLSLQAAAEAADAHPDGVFFVPLANITDPALVMSAVAGALGLATTGAQTPLELVADHLRERRALLVLDNFEQVLGAGVDVAKVLAAASAVTALITSRAALMISGEQEYPVPPLSLPEPSEADVDQVAGSEAALLFVARATAIQPDFRLTVGNATAVTEIVRRLDGLPLAIELAASRVRILPVEAIAARLGETLDLLSSGPRDLPDRQRSLRGAIAWSYDLLDQPGRILFARMSVFRGGADFDHLEQVCGPGLDADVFDVLSELVDHSLVRRGGMGAGARFAMLETIREFASECLRSNDERPGLRRRHAETFLALAEAAEPHLTGRDSAAWLDRLEADHDNLRAALRRSMDDGDTRTALRFVAALWRLWQIRGHLHEGRRIADAVLGLTGVDGYRADLAAACEAAGGLAYWQADFEASRAHYRRALDLRRELGDEPGVARSLYNLGFSFMADGGREMIPVFEEALAAYQRLGDDLGAARAHWGLGVGAFWSGDFDMLIHHADQCIPTFRAAGETFDLAWALHVRGMGDCANQRYEQARDLFVESLNLFVSANDASGYYLLLADFAMLAESAGDMSRALRLYGAVERLGEETGGGLLDQQLALMPRARHFEDEVDPAEIEALKAEGRAMTREQAVAYALEA